MLITSIVIGLIALLYAFWVDVHSDGDRSPTRACVALGVGLAVVLAGIVSAHAEDFTFDPPKSDWSTPDTWREGAFQGLWLIDALQTHTIVKHETPVITYSTVGGTLYKTTSYNYEQNTILGKDPTMGAVNRFFIVGSAVHIGISYLLPDTVTLPFGLGSFSTRKDWQYVTIVNEGVTTLHNKFVLKLGVGF